MKFPFLSLILLLAATSAVRGQSTQSACESLGQNVQLKELSIKATFAVAETRTPPGPVARPISIPEHCRVVAIVQPVPDSRIEVEVWLPDTAAWNGKFLGTGNGGYSSSLSIADMAEALRQGYATAGSDTGHQGDNLSFGDGHPEKIRDWAYRATHVMAETAKQVLSAYYGHPSQHAYFKGCSTGGQQALSEAQRFPDDFEGIIAGDPGYDRIALNSMFVWSWLVTHPDGQPPLAAAKLPLVARAAMETCGNKDGIIVDPQQCHPSLAALRCTADGQAACLTDADLHQVEQLYQGPRDTAGHQLFPGWEPGSEAGWSSYFVGHSEPARLEFWRLWVFKDPRWDPRSFQFERDRNIALNRLPYVDATSPNLNAFHQRGGKLLLYHGLADPVVPPEDSVRYLNSVQRESGSSTSKFMRLFLVPGMYHCAGGPGPNSFDSLGALDDWVIHGTAPEKMVAQHHTDGGTEFTGLLCPYPASAQPDPKLDPHKAASFTCRSKTGTLVPAN